MAKQQAAKKQPNQTRNQEPRTGTMARGAAQTGERDDVYNLVSVLYHSLQGADTVSNYLGNAQQSRDKDVQSFLDRVRANYVELADEAKQLLADRLGEGRDDEEDDDADEESDEEE